MSRRLLLCFLLIVLIPLGLLGWLGIRVGINDDAQVKQQVQKVLLARLRDIRSQVVRTIESSERELLRAFEVWENKNKQRRAQWRKQQKTSNRAPTIQRRKWFGYGIQGYRQAKKQAQKRLTKAGLQKDQMERLQQLQRRGVLVRQAFLMDRAGRLTFPRQQATMSPQEKAFLQRTKAIWERRAILAQPQGTGRRYESWRPLASSSVFSGSRGNSSGNANLNNNAPIAQNKSAKSVKSIKSIKSMFRRRPTTRLAQQQKSNRPKSALYARKSFFSYGKRLLNSTSPQQQKTRKVRLSRVVPNKKAVLSKSDQRGDSMLGLAAGRPHGWIVWYWAEGLHLLLWKRLDGGGIVGVEVDRIVLMSRLIGALPETSSGGSRQQGRVLLVDEKGATIYQWGNYETAKGEAPLATLQLGYPLHTWKLVYFGPERKTFSALTSRIHTQMLLLLFLVGCVVVGASVYLYREYSRDMRDAAQRVTFVTQVSHELKTPLTNIRLYAELLEGKIPDEQPRARRHVNVIVDESQRLSRLINNILTFARQQRNSHKIRPSRIVVDEVLTRIAEPFAPGFRAKGFDVLEEHNAPRPIVSDADAIEQIVGNLLSNVEKYASQGQWVAIRSHQEPDGTTHIDVEDRGPGIPRGMQSSVFQPFTRCSEALTEGVSGTGIGLTIARDLAWMLGGDLTLRSGQEGACFRLTLPPETPPQTERDNA